MRISKKKLKEILTRELRDTGMSHWLVPRLMKALKEQK